MIGTYQPLVAQAFKQGARVVVLPENTAWATAGSDKTMWLDTLSRWARQGQATIVAGMFDETTSRNQVTIAGPDGRLLATYSKRRH